MFKKTLLSAITLLLAGAGPIDAGTVALPSVADTNLIEAGNGNLANGRGTEMRAGLNGQGFRFHAVVRFDVAGSVPAGSTVESATLILYSTGGGTTDPQNVDLHRLTAAWGEAGSVSPGGQGVPGAPGDATWLYRFYNPAAPGESPTWAMAGGDYVGEPSAMTLIDDVGYHSWSSADMTADVQLWVDDPGQNHGWALVGNEGTNQSAKKFATREGEDETLRPVLIVEYSSANGDDEGDDDEGGDDEGHDHPRPHSRSNYGNGISAVGGR